MDPLTALFWLAVSFAVSYAFRPKTTIEQGRVQDLEVQASTYGTFVKKVYGRARIAGNLIWIRDGKISERRQTKTKDGVKTRTYTYYGDFAIGVCEGPVRITAMWADTDVIAQQGDNKTSDGTYWSQILASIDSVHLISGGTSDSADTPIVSVLKQRGDELTIFRGGDAQPPSPRIIEEHGDAGTPAWRGLSYVTLNEFPLKDYGNRIPDCRFEVVSNANTVGFDAVLVVWLGEGQAVYGGGLKHRSYVIEGNILKYCKTQGTSGGGNLWYETWIDIPTGTVLYQDFRDLSPEWTSLSSGGGIVRNDIRFYMKSHLSYAGGLDSGSSFYVRGKTYDTAIGMPYHPETLTWAGTDNTYWRRGDYIYTRVYNYSWPNPGNSGNGHRFAKFALPPDWANRNIPVSGGMPMVDWLPGLSNNGYEYYDAQYDEWMVSNGEQGNIWILDGETLAIKESFALPANFLGPSAKWGDVCIGSNGTLPFEAEVWRFNRGQGNLTRIATAEYVPALDSYLRFDYFADFIGPNQIICEDGIYTWFLPDENGVSLEYVVTDIMTSAGIDAADIDATALSGDLVRGYVLDKYDTARSHIEPLMMMYQFDLVERDYKLTAVKRTATYSEDVQYDALGATENGSSADRITVVEEDTTQLPSRININFSNLDNDYEPGVEFARRKTVSTVNVLDVQTSMVFTSDEAAQKADILLREAWLGGRYKNQFSLTKKYSYLEPADVIRIVPSSAGQMSDRALIVRINRIQEGANGILQIEGSEVGSTSYQSSAKGAVYPPKYPTAQAPVSPTIARLIDIPTVLDNDFPDPGAYIAFAGLYSNWAGAQFRISRDDGATYTDTGDFCDDSVIIGSLQDTRLGDWIYENIDRVNTVTVTIASTWQALESCTETELLNGKNRCAIGVDGRWEICSFQTVELIGPQKYRLSNFIRGECGTENFKGAHLTYEQFVFFGTMQIDKPKPIRFPLLDTDYNVERDYEFQGLADADPTNFGQHTTQLLCNAPFPGAHVRGFRDGTGDVRINWFRQGRWDRGWFDSRENYEPDLAEYEIDIYTSSTYATLQRTVTGLTTPAYNYTAALQTTDFGAPQATVYVRVYQMSSNTTRGRGIYKQAAI